jgi:hypothetical protein
MQRLLAPVDTTATKALSDLASGGDFDEKVRFTRPSFSRSREANGGQEAGQGIASAANAITKTSAKAASSASDPITRGKSI